MPHFCLSIEVKCVAFVTLAAVMFVHMQLCFCQMQMAFHKDKWSKQKSAKKTKGLNKNNIALHLGKVI